jgi:hypothetical protein
VARANSAAKTRRVPTGGRGRHRRPTHRRTEAFAWLGAGAVTFGIGAALASGSGVANADTPDDAGASPSASAEEGKPAVGAEPLNLGPKVEQVSESKTDSASAEAFSSTTGRHGFKQPAMKFSATGGNVTGRVSASSAGDAPQVSTALTAQRENGSRLANQQATKLVSDSAAASLRSIDDARAALGAVAKDVASELEESTTAVAAAITPFATAAHIAPVTVPGLPANPIAGPSEAAAIGGAPSSTTVQPLAGLAALEVTDPAREQYLQKFRLADPTGRFYTPASPDYSSPSGAPDIEQSVGQYGTAGFSRNNEGQLTYTNKTNHDVAVMYGADPAKDPDGIVTARPGQTVAVPRAYAAAQAPRQSEGEYNIIAVAAPGHPPTGSTGGGPIRTYPSSSTFITQINSVLTGNAFSTAVNYASNIASLLGANGVSKALNATAAFIAGYNGNFSAVVAQGVQAFGSGISSYAATMATRFPAAAPASGVLYLAGAAVTTWGYVAEQASYIDPNSTGTTVDYIKKNPGVVVQELGKATTKVVSDLGSAFIGAVGGIFRFGR